MISNFGLQASAGFDPRQIPGLIGWWDVAAVNGFGGENPVEDEIVVSWRDLSGGNNHLELSETSRGPNYSQQGMIFNDSVVMSMVASSLPTPSKATLMHVYKIDTPNDQVYASLLQFGSSNYRISHQPAPTGRHNRVRWDKSSNTNVTINGVNTDNTMPHIITMASELDIIGAGQYKCRTDGLDTGSGTFSDGSSANYPGNLIRYSDSAGQSRTHAILLYDGYLDNTACLRVERWLGKRFGVAVA